MSLIFFFKSVPKPTNPNSIQPVPIAKDKNEETKHTVATSSAQIPENSLAAAPPKKKSRMELEFELTNDITPEVKTWANKQSSLYK